MEWLGLVLTIIEYDGGSVDVLMEQFDGLFVLVLVFVDDSLLRLGKILMKISLLDFLFGFLKI